MVRELRRTFTPLPVAPLLVDAIRISVETGASVYDTLYIAAAAALGLRLITADARLVARMAGTSHAALLMPLDSFNGSP